MNHNPNNGSHSRRHRSFFAARTDPAATSSILTELHLICLCGYRTVGSGAKSSQLVGIVIRLVLQRHFFIDLSKTAILVGSYGKSGQLVLQRMTSIGGSYS